MEARLKRERAEDEEDDRIAAAMVVAAPSAIEQLMLRQDGAMRYMLRVRVS